MLKEFRGGATESVDTIFGRFARGSKRRLDITFDYELAEILAFRDLGEILRPTLFLDVGANIGVYAVHLARTPGLARVLAFEPAPASFRALKENFALQPRRDLQAFDLALSDAAGTAEFAIFGDQAGNNALAETLRGGRGDPRIATVRTARLDDVVSASGETFMMKVDVEGHERRMLKGAERLLRDNTGLLQIEAFAELDALDAQLAELGYERLFRLKNDHYYGNLVDPGLRRRCVDALLDRTAEALGALKDERRRRRAAIRAARKTVEAAGGGDPAAAAAAARETLDLLRYGRDPLTPPNNRG